MRMASFETPHPNPFNEEFVLPSDRPKEPLSSRLRTTATGIREKLKRKKEESALAGEGVRNLNRDYAKDPEARLLLEKLQKRLEHGAELDLFDGESVALLEQVLKDADKKKIFQHIYRYSGKLFVFLAPKAAGLLAGYEGATDIGPSWAVKNIGLGLSKVLFLDGSLGEAINSGITTPLIFIIAYPVGTLVGTVAGGIAGYALGAGTVGGTLGVVKEHKRATGYEPLKELIENYTEGEKRRDFRDASGNDMRLQLVKLIGEYMNKPETRRQLTNEEWVELVATARRARISLAREYMRPAHIISGDPAVADSLKKQSRLVDRIIRGNEELSEADRVAARSLLEQFNYELSEDARHASLKSVEIPEDRERYRDYALAFFREGYRASGLSFFCRALSFGARVGTLPIRKLRG